jgi:hypothetical protein
MYIFSIICKRVKRDKRIDKIKKGSALMGTRGFVGYKKDGKIKGFYNNNDSYYSYLGSKVLVKFGAYSNKEIEDFFTKRLELIENDVKDKFYENHREIWGIDWSTDSIKLQDGTGFLLDSLICF